jgi:hypothetical protein
MQIRACVTTGLLLIAATVLVIVLSDAWGLQAESSALTGVATGAVIGLVPDRSVGARLGSYLLGVVAAFVGFALRALVLPDTNSGRIVGAVVTLAICVIVAAAGLGRHLPLWAVLLGTASFSGVYEVPFAAAVPEMARTSIDALTALLLAVCVGVVVAGLTVPRPARAGETASEPVAPKGSEPAGSLKEVGL